MEAGEVDNDNGGPRLPLRLIVLLAVAHAAFSAGRLALALQAVQLRATPFEVGVIMSLLMVVPMFVAVHIGRWGDRRGFFVPAMIGCGVLVASGVLAAFIPSLVVLGLASVLVGTGYMLCHVSVNNAIGVASTPQTRAQAFGAMAVAFSISGLVGPMLAGFAIDHGGYVAAFAIVALFPVVSVLMMVVPRRMAAHASHAPAPHRDSRVTDLLRHAPLRSVLIVSGVLSMGWDLFMFLLPLHGVRVGLTASAIGLVVGAFGVGSFAVRLAIPRLVRAFDEWSVLRATLALTALCYIAFPFCAGLFTLLPLAFALGAFLGCGQPLGMSLIHLTAPPSRSGEAVGVRSTITSMSQTLLPLLFGAVGTAVGMVPMFWTAATVLASGSAYAGRRRPY